MKTKKSRTRKVEVRLSLRPYELSTLRFEVPADANDDEVMDIAEDYRANLGDLEIADAPIEYDIDRLTQTAHVGARFVRGDKGKLVLAKKPLV